MAPDARLEQSLADHRRSVDEFLDRAGRIAPDQWGRPRGEGKWTPAQEVTHLVLVYEAFTRDLRDGASMRLVGTPAKRFVWRIIGLTSILRLGRLPTGARAPREARPPETTESSGVLLATLRVRVDEFEAAFADAWQNRSGTRVTHPYFGTLSLRHSIKVCEVHTYHHAALIGGVSEVAVDRDVTEESLPEFLAGRARRASDGRLAIDVAAGFVVAVAALLWRGPAWYVFLSAALCFLSYGAWGIADRELTERLTRSQPALPALRGARVIATITGVLAAVMLVLGSLNVALGTIKS